MPITPFTRAEFEAALPISKYSGRPLWERATDFAEYSYTITVNPYVQIRILSSILRGETYCGNNGKNSIRAWLVAPDQTPLAAKDQRWITRQGDWKGRLLSVLRAMYKLGSKLGQCPVCGIGTTCLRKVKKQGPNHGRTYYACSKKGCKYFQWAEITTQNQSTSCTG